MKDGSEEKIMPLFWLHWLHADCDVCMVIRKHLGSNSKLPLDFYKLPIHQVWCH